MATTAECPDGDSVPVAVPYEANQPAGQNWRLGLEMAVAEINDAGGILGCQIVPEFQDTQADPDVSKQVVADMAEGNPYVFLGTVFSSNTIVNMVEAQRAEIPMFVGAEAPAITNREENGDNDFIYRTSFGVDTASAKFIELHRRPGRDVDRHDLQERRVRRRRSGTRTRRRSKRSGSRFNSTSRSSRTRSTCRPKSPSWPAEVPTRSSPS